MDAIESSLKLEPQLLPRHRVRPQQNDTITPFRSEMPSLIIFVNQFSDRYNHACPETDGQFLFAGVRECA